MKHSVLYRFSTNGEGVFSAGKRLLPEKLVAEANEARKWLPKPSLLGDLRFYFTLKGKEKYEKTLFLVHKKYLPHIVCEKIVFDYLLETVYEDEWQVVVENYS